MPTTMHHIPGFNGFRVFDLQSSLERVDDASRSVHNGEDAAASSSQCYMPQLHVGNSNISARIFRELSGDLWRRTRSGCSGHSES